MPLITKKETQDVQTRIRINKDVLKEVNEYIEWANLDNPNNFFEEAALFVLRKDKEWKQVKAQKAKSKE